MQVIETDILGPVIIEPDVFGDERGYFLEAWSHSRYADHGLNVQFVQDNLSYSRKGTLRGLHFQNPKPQGKLVYVPHGEVFDVAVDIRHDSPTFGEWLGVTLSAANKRQFYVPPGFAHGFCVLSDEALFAYKCTDYYSPSSEHSIRWNDPDIAIEWPISSPIVSLKDSSAKFLRVYDNSYLSFESST